MSSEPDYSLCPACPEIKKKIDRIDLALMGPDGTGMKEGIVHAIIRILLFLYSVFIFIMSNNDCFVCQYSTKGEQLVLSSLPNYVKR